MANRRVICTGNPDKPFTIASSVKKYFPNATFIHKSNGFDLVDMDEATQSRLSELFKTHNTFINASYLGHGTQTKMLELCNKSVKFCDVFNIGSCYEYLEGGDSRYTNSKIELRAKSLELNTYRFKTCHMVLGSIKQSESKEFQEFIDTDEICDVITWVINQRFGVPLISLEQPKQAW